MEVPHHVSVPLTAMIAERFQQLSGPMRIRIRDRLRDGPNRDGPTPTRPS